MTNISTLSDFHPQFRTDLVQNSPPAWSKSPASNVPSPDADYQFLAHPQKNSIYAGEQLSAQAPELQLPLLLHPKDAEKLQKLLLAEHQKEAPAQVEVTGNFQALDGFSWITCSLTARPLPTVYRDLLGWHVVASIKQPAANVSLKSRGEQALFILSQLHHAGLWSYNPLNEMLELDAALQKLLNLSKPSFKIQEWLRYIHPDDVKRLLKKVFELQRKGGLFQLNIRYQGPSGKRYRYLTLSASSFLTEGKGFSITGLCYDGTYQQRLQSKSLLNKVFLDEAQSLGNIGCFEWQPQLNKLVATRQLKLITGLPKEEDFSLDFLSKSLMPEDLAAVEHLYAAFLAGEQTQELTVRFRHNSGKMQTLWFQAKAFYHKGSMTSLIGIVQDISDRANKQVQIQAKDRLINGFLKNLPVCIIAVNRKEQIVSVIGNGLKATGLERKKLIGSSVSVISAGFANQLEQVFKGSPKSFVAESDNDHGSFSIFNYYYFDAERDLAVGFSLDITSIKQAELTKAHLNELENRYQLMETFVHAVAHDLRSPVVNLDMLLTFFAQENSPEDQQKYVAAMNNGIQHLKRTLDALIEILRIEKDSNVAADEIRFDELLQELEQEYGKKLKEAAGSINVYLQCETIRYNKAYLSSILRNLISNAIKYSYPGRPPQISICTEQKGNVVLLLVQDNGMGMDLKKWGHQLFKPFKRLNNHKKGTGIGLHLVKQIIEKNGGKIKVKSQPGSGSTFFCFLRAY
ncbi:two-component system-sensor histidine kinase [Flammeovirgaceae bacterium 311]|nr:two-component system-sensor histidine kinase [Flammeovirgaceae bacterium 311]